ncbi:hypothetical protein [Rhodoplanes sp. Z2-YC6860]|uniref:hypothetical protein n=1 Tax=Rhodoplanes sp. Z2-YC6860 TaxID=674703 RepID=UPI00078C8C9F|nr:hypothetical protein [Rhodoplanes sp. Z2-YC6860]AMN41384.1 hypothetical protein RHPLAN_29470 [Rhodoplanes sp. Z2-YC6860]
MGTDALLVGSIPLDSVEDVFREFGAPLGASLKTLPDGEVGPRKHWISRIHYQVLSGHPELEAVQRPGPDENGVEKQFPRNASEAWWFKVKDGVERVRFGDPGWRIGYARDAINSYFVFKTLREKGVLPKHLRFQVSLASVNSALPPRIFPNHADLAKIRPGFTDALVAEAAMIVSKIPNEDLAIQWDCSTEVQDAYGAVQGFSAADAVERNSAQFRTLSKAIPETVQLGYHLCFGTLGGWPRFAPPDLGATVALANGVIEASGRRVDWIHIPVLPDVGENFFAPLKNLKPRGARVYLGVVHHMDGFKERIAMARKFLPDFGVAGYCGFGRVPPKDLPQVLKEHQQAIAAA